MDSLGYPVTNIMPYPALKARCNREIPRVQIEDLYSGYFALRGIKILKNLLEKENNCVNICVEYNCNALQFWSGRKLFGPP